jgi:hypothetical protein
MIVKTKKTETLDAGSFTGMHLNETGSVEEFIVKLKTEIFTFEPDQKKEYVQSVMQRVNHEKDWHHSLCALDECSVKQYFEKCIKMLEEI